MKAFEYKGLVDGAWVVMPEEEWNRFQGMRMLADLEYHGPAYEADGRPTEAIRECRCDTCTLFEPGRVLSPAVQQVIDYMLRAKVE